MFILVSKKGKACAIAPHLASGMVLSAADYVIDATGIAPIITRGTHSIHKGMCLSMEQAVRLIEADLDKTIEIPIQIFNNSNAAVISLRSGK